MSYEVVYTSRGKRDFAKLPRNVQESVLVAIMKLGENPRPHGCLKVQGKHDEWRIRVGDFRVAYGIDDIARSVEIRRAGKRDHFYEQR